MPEQIDTPSGIGANTDWGLHGSRATSKIQALSANDGDRSVVFAASGGRLVVDDYAFPELLGVADPVNSASLTAITREHLSGGGGRGYNLRWNSTSSGVNKQSSVHVARPNYVSVSYDITGAGLALDAVNGEHGIQFTAAGGPSNKGEFWVTHLFRTVDFDYEAGSAGDFAHLIGSLVGFLIGGGLMLREMAAVSAAMGRIRLRPDEYERAWRDWHAQKRMVLV